MNNWKNLISLFWINAILFLTFIPKTWCCASGFDDMYLGYRFVSMNIVEDQTDFTPYLLSFGGGHLSDEQATDIQKKDNLKEWQKYTCQSVSLEEIEELIYTSTTEQLELLKRLTKRGGKIPGIWSSNYFVKSLMQNKCSDTFEYLHFAKKCEPHAMPFDSWDKKRSLSPEINELIALGKRNLLRTKNQFLRMRYMYQIVRLAHYAHDYQGALDLYDELDPKVDDNDTIIQWWLLGHKAGCLKRLGKNTEAAYLFSRVFKNCPSKREQVFRSFQIESDQEWNAVLLKCKSDEERATLYALRATDWNAQITEELESIYKLDPSSDHLTPLMVKEIYNLEETFLGADFRRDIDATKPDKIAKNRLIKLLSFVTKVLSENKIKDIPIWTVAQGYLEYLSRDLYAADKTYEKAESLVRGNEALEDHLELFQLALKVHAYTRVNKKIEDEISGYIRSNKYFESVETFPIFLFDRLSQLYKKQGNYAKSFLCNFEMDDLKINPQLKYIKDLIALAEKPNHTDFEEYLLQKKLGVNYISELYEMKGTYHLSKFELSEAIQSFSKIKGSQFENEKFTPFVLPILDCIHCEIDVEDSTILQVNKLELTHLLLDYEYKAKTDIEHADKYYYLLGAAYYNMSYYGHSYGLIDYYRSSQSWLEAPKKETSNLEPKASPFNLTFGNKEYTDISSALFFFDKCKEMTQNSELAAKASFMAAKCELIKFYQDDKYQFNTWSNDIPKLPEKYRNYYDLLKNKYSDTEFYKEAIKECKYFSYYVEKGM